MFDYNSYNYIAYLYDSFSLVYFISSLVFAYITFLLVLEKNLRYLLYTVHKTEAISCN